MERNEILFRRYTYQCGRNLDNQDRIRVEIWKHILASETNRMIHVGLLARRAMEACEKGNKKECLMDCPIRELKNKAKIS